MATTSTDSPPVDSQPPAGANRFFGWLRALDLPRQPGWLGGVCAGLANRLGIDPLIVRGIVVVIAILGGPAFLLYAAAWLLLPDQHDRIHLERLIRGEFDRAVVGVAVLAVLAVLPITQGFWFLGANYWGQPYWGDSIGRGIWTVVLIAAAIGVIIWLARRPGRAAATPTVVPATTDARPDTVPEPPAAETAAPLPPAAPAAGAPAEELSAWKEQQARWKREHAAWREQQQATAREVRAARAAEAEARARATAEAAAERRRLRRLSDPRVSGGFVAIVLGVALLAGAIVTLLVSQGEDSSLRGYAGTLGVASATVVVGLSLVASGLWRRRNGFLGFVAVILMLVSVATAFLPRDRSLLAPQATLAMSDAGRYSQPVGHLEVVGQAGEATPGSIDVWQGAGSISAWLPAGATVRIVADLDDGTMRLRTGSGTDSRESTPAFTRATDGDRHYDVVVGPGTKPELTIRLRQGAGSVFVAQNPPADSTGDTEGDDK